MFTCTENFPSKCCRDDGHTYCGTACRSVHFTVSLNVWEIIRRKWLTSRNAEDSAQISSLVFFRATIGSGATHTSVLCVLEQLSRRTERPDREADRHLPVVPRSNLRETWLQCSLRTVVSWSQCSWWLQTVRSNLLPPFSGRKMETAVPSGHI